MISLESLPRDARLPLITLIVTEAARAKAFKHKWQKYGAIVVSNERATAVSRGDLIGHLKSNGMDAEAREAQRTLRPGEVLVWFAVDAPDASVAGLSVVNLQRECAAVEAMDLGAAPAD